jgi:predicted adenylyl cyclase CyaB
MKNIEVKYRCDNHKEIKRAAIKLGAKFVCQLNQVDTFYNSALARLKLRCEENHPATLIAYTRADEIGSKLSDYTLLQCAEPEALHTILAQSIGIKGTLSKQRTLYLLDNLRIHLDKVIGLGDFVELELVLDDESDVLKEKQHLEEIIILLGLDNYEPIACAYFDLLIGN